MPTSTPALPLNVTLVHLAAYHDPRSLLTVPSHGPHRSLLFCKSLSSFQMNISCLENNKHLLRHGSQAPLIPPLRMPFRLKSRISGGCSYLKTPLGEDPSFVPTAMVAGRTPLFTGS
ncbi:Hypothetical predicted protein [Marmota monax]|uniref:Uncharacterized protein n=1 Tax=Marmota monax TaxID=9995 RepID=A0A5E4B658_MARMO|nr:hypothetical protein GHT09_001295 [Marmota monax]VTJ65124.1 Hypothetical predicted protein [Marmota monax]